MASGVLGAEHQAHEGAGGVLSEPPTRRAFGIRIRGDTAHTNRQPLSHRVAESDAATRWTPPRSSMPSSRILNRPAPTVRRHDFCGARLHGTNA